MASNDFGLTVENVRAHHFPHADAWTDGSRPSETAVEEAIAEEAAEMGGKLALELIDASSIGTDTDAWLNCKKVLRKQVAVRVARDMLGNDASVFGVWAAEVVAWYEAMEIGGASFVGEGATTTGDEEPDGPTWHGTELEQDSTENMSSTIPKLRKDDRL